MLKSLPTLTRRNAPWTPLQRQTWLATRRRKQRLPHVPVLRPAYAELLQWDWNHAEPFRWNVFQSLDGGETYFFIEDYWADGSARHFAPDGGSELYFIVGVDADGNEVTAHSNAVRPDDYEIGLGSLLTGLFSYWKLNETGGTRADATGRGQNLSDVNDDTGSGAGIIGNAADFSATTYGLASTGPGIRGGDMTVSFWVNSPSMTDCHHNVFYQSYDMSIYYYFSEGGNPGTAVVDYANGNVICSVYDGVQNNSPTGWFHIVGVRRGNRLEIYRDGVRRFFYDSYSTDVIVGDIYSPGWPDQFFIGSNGGDDFVQGMMDEVGVWSRALSPEEIALLYNSGQGLAYEDF